MDLGAYLILLVFIGPGLIITASGHPIIGTLAIVSSPATVLSGPFGAIGLWVVAMFLYKTKP